MRFKLSIIAVLAGMVVALGACKTTVPGGESGISGIEAANDELLNKDGSFRAENESFFVYADGDVYLNPRDYNKMANTKVHLRLCPKWKRSDRIDLSKQENFDPTSVTFVIDWEKLKDPATQRAELEKLEAVVQAYKKDVGSVTTSQMKSTFNLNECKGEDRFYAALPAVTYISMIKQEVGYVEKSTTDAKRRQLEEMQFTIKDTVDTLKDAKNQVDKQRMNLDDYHKLVKAFAGLMKTANDLHEDIKVEEKRRRIVVDIASFLPLERDATIRRTREPVAYNAVLKPFEIARKKNMDEYNRVRRDMRFAYIGKKPYLEGMEECRKQGMVMAGRLEFYYLMRYINGFDPIPGWQDDGDSGQQSGQDQNPVDPEVRRLSGDFWAATFSYDLSRQMAWRNYKRSRGEDTSAVDPYDKEALANYADALFYHLPANFHYTSEVLLEGRDNQFGYNYAWVFDTSGSEYKATGLYAGEKHTLCVENSNFNYEDRFIKFVKAKVGGDNGSDRYEGYRYNWERNAKPNGHAPYLFAFAGTGHGQISGWQRRDSTDMWICSAEMPGFALGRSVTYNFHRLTYVDAQQTKPEQLWKKITRSCETHNRTVIKGQGTCKIDVCDRCFNLLDKGPFPCSKEEEDDQDQKQEEDKSQDQDQNQDMDQFDQDLYDQNQFDQFN